jgi:hypothetical protein
VFPLAVALVRQSTLFHSWQVPPANPYDLSLGQNFYIALLSLPELQKLTLPSFSPTLEWSCSSATAGVEPIARDIDTATDNLRVFMDSSIHLA